MTTNITANEFLHQSRYNSGTTHLHMFLMKSCVDITIVGVSTPGSVQKDAALLPAI